MRLSRILGAAAAALLFAAGPACANPKNALDAYVESPDPAFGWTIAKPISGPGYHGTVLKLTSQSWLTSKQVDHPVWTHWLTVIVPDKVAYKTGLLFITGGKIDDAVPEKPTDRFVKMALETRSVVSELDDVPNQPLRFTEDPKPRIEDEIIAYQQAKFGTDHDPLDLPRLPMVKSGVAAMTAVQEYLASDQGGKLALDHFVVSGGSKRAWTTWLVGALDKRVEAIIPIVINVLDVDATTRHHWEAMGYFSPALKDYVENGLIPDQIGKPGIEAVNAIEDPLNYRDRPAMKMPKYVINAVGDEYFPPDNTRYSYHLLPQVKRLRMIPNSKHSTAETDINESITAFYAAVLNRWPIPDYSWTVGKDGAITLRSKLKPLAVKLWRGTNSTARDFRVDTIGKAFTSTRLKPKPDGTFTGNVPKPKTGFTAYFLEALYPSGTKYPFKFTTEVYVKPDVLPYRWADARAITAPDAKWKPAAEALKAAASH